MLGMEGRGKVLKPGLGLGRKNNARPLETIQRGRTGRNGLHGLLCFRRDVDKSHNREANSAHTISRPL